MENEGVYTAYVGRNALLIEKVSQLHFKKGDKIADITYGKGVFWKNVDLNQYDFFPSDIITCPDTLYDFKNLPYQNDSFDVIVFDPPYAHNPGRMIVDANYQNAATTKGFYHKDIMNLYKEGMTEAYRCLKPGGILLVKCQDEVESSKQKRSHIEIFHIAIDELSMIDKAMYSLVSQQKPVIQHKNQKHPRQNSSFLWVFQKKEDKKDGRSKC